MDTDLCVIYLLCWLCYGCSASNNADNVNLVLTEHDCVENNNNNDTSVRYEPVLYDEVFELEDQIMKLIANGEIIRLSESGLLMDTVYAQNKACYKMEDSRVSEISKTILSAMEMSLEQSFQHSLKNNYHGIGFLGCVFFRINPGDFTKVDTKKCFLGPPYFFFHVIIMEGFAYFDAKRDDLLCKYIVDSDTRGVEYLYSRCDLPNDGDLCTDDEKGTNLDYILGRVVIDHETYVMMPDVGVVKTNSCESSCSYKSYLEVGDIMKDAKAKLSLKLLMQRANDSVYQTRYIDTDYDHYENNRDIYSNRDNIIPDIDRFKLEPEINYNHRVEMFKIYNKDGGLRVLLSRDADRLFVDTDYDFFPLKYLCKKISNNTVNSNIGTTATLEIDNETTNSNNYGNKTKTSNVIGSKNHDTLLVIVSVSVGIILAAGLVIVIVRQNFKRKCGTRNTNIHLGDGEDMGHISVAGSVSWRAEGVDADSYTGSITIRGGTVDNDSYGGSVPGRGGTVMDDSYGGSVPGRGGTFVDDLYGGSVYGRGGTVMDDSYGGSVSGRGGTVDDNSYGGSVSGRGGTVDDNS